MKLVRIKTSEQVHLDDGLLWEDEFDWQPIEQHVERGLDGTLIVQEGVKKLGQSMSLVAPNENQGFIKRKDLNVLKSWLGLQERFKLVFEYPHDKREFVVIFNHEQGALQAKPVMGFPTVSDDDYYSLSLRFLQVF